MTEPSHAETMKNIVYVCVSLFLLPLLELTEQEVSV